jgi:hypothetical protein
LLAKMLARIDAIDADIAELDATIEAMTALSPRRGNGWMRSSASAPSPLRSSSPRWGWT